MKVIGIIPVKKTSERLPGKNFMLIAGCELWVHSVEYAKAEGIEPVVSTDSADVMEWCRRQEVRYIEELVDDRNMCNCIDQVLKEVSCDYFVLLQPTSPIRQPGLVQNILTLGVDTSVYTADKVKIIGHIGGQFHTAYRDQEASTKFLYHFDGNIVVANTPWYRNNRKLFNDESKWVVEGVPYSLQIDTESDFKLIERIMD